MNLLPKLLFAHEKLTIFATEFAKETRFYMKKTFLIALSLLFVGMAGNAKVTTTDDNSKASDGVEAVDLGLSVKWASMNVGATKDSGFGTYFAWGEVKPKQYYSWGTYLWSQGDTSFLLKYNASDKKTQLTPFDDAARANMGGEWRMPTVDECEELIDPDNCDWQWITKDGVNGYKVTGKKTGNSIFLPITGFRFYGDVQFRAIKGIYWTSTIYTGNYNKAWCIEFNFEDVKVDFGNLSTNRFSGRCIRAVK